MTIEPAQTCATDRQTTMAALPCHHNLHVRLALRPLPARARLSLTRSASASVSLGLPRSPSNASLTHQPSDCRSSMSCRLVGRPPPVQPTSRPSSWFAGRRAASPVHCPPPASAPNAYIHTCIHTCSLVFCSGLTE